MRTYLGLLLVILFTFPVISQVEPDTSKVRADSLGTAIFSLTSDDLDNDAQNQDVSSLLQSSRDVFASIAGYNFSAARYRMRGYQSDQYAILMNGVQMNNPEIGWGIWAFWGGLNDVTRYPEVGNGITSSDYTFGNIGGYSNIDLRASRFRKGSRASYALTNRTYRNRVMFTHATGMMKNGWAFAISGSARWSEEGYIEGTSYSAASYFLSVEKKINDKHTLGFSGFGAPTVQGRAGIAVQETYDLTGSNYYNPYWGYQTDGEGGEKVKRNARMRNNHQPSLFLTHYWNIDKKKTVQTTLYGTFGRTGNTNLNWYDAPDPRPDYYRYLPSYYETENPAYAAQLTEAWSSDPSVSQINWDGLYNANYKNLYTLEDANGVEGNDVTFNRSKYIVEEYRTDPVQIGLNSIFNMELASGYRISSGLNIDRYVSHNFKIVDDLLGGDYWVDVNQFAEQDYSDPTAALNDTEVQNKLVGVGEKHGYNYDIHVNTASAFGQISKNTKRIDWYGGLQLSYTTFYRDGLWQNGIFPDDSKGESEHLSFFNYGVKGGAVYKVTGRHFITANAMYQTKAPYSRNAFISPRTRNTVVKDLKSSEIISGDLNYQVRYPGFKLRATVFYSEINNQIWTRSFYHDVFRNFVNYTMNGVDQQFTGTEIGAEKTIMDSWVISAAFSKGMYTYNSRPTATVTVDNSNEILAEDRTVYFKNYRIGGMPQTAASIGVKYNSPKYWYVGFSFNYYTNIYLDPNPDRRTAEAVTKYVETDPQWGEVLDQTVIHDLEHNDFFDNNYTLDAYAGVSFKIKKDFLRINLSANNVLNNTSFLTGGFEQLRYDANDIGKFPPKFGYMYGTTFFLMASYLF